MGRKKRWPPSIFHRGGRDITRIDGRDYPLGPTGSEQAQQEYARLIAAHAAGTLQAPVTRTYGTIRQLVTAWDEYAQRHYSPEGREAKQYEFTTRLLVERFGSMKADKFTEIELTLLQQAMCDKDWCRNVVNRRIVRIRTVWRWAELRGLVPPGSWARLRAVRPLMPSSRLARSTEPIKPCEPEDLERVAVCASPPVAAVLRLMLLTGARPSELYRMRTCDINRTEELWTYEPVHHKTEHHGRQRVIFFGPRAQHILTPWLGPPNLVCFRPLLGRRLKNGTYKLSSGMYSETTFARAVHRAADKAGITLTAYTARHAAKRRLTRSHGLDAARAVLGHASLATTDNYAAEVDLDLARKTARESG